MIKTRNMIFHRNVLFAFDSITYVKMNLLKALLITVLFMWKQTEGNLGEWGEWKACSVTCGVGQRSRERCKKNLKPGHLCPLGQVTTETEECTAVSCGSSSFREEPMSLQTYFTAEKDWFLLNNKKKEIRTSSDIACALFCLRDPNCKSINFKITAEDSNQQKIANTKRTPNCELNAAVHVTHPKDFIPRKGYCYYQVK